MLSSDQIHSYQKNGFLHVERLLAADLLASLQEEASLLIEELQQGAPLPQDGALRHAVFREPVPNGTDPRTGPVFGIMDLVDYRAVFTRLLFFEPLVDTLNRLIGPGVQLHHTRMITKGSAKKTKRSEGWVVGTHQDQPFFPHREHSVIAAWMPMVDITSENGALRVVPGSHNIGPLEHQGGPESGFRLDPHEWPITRGSPLYARAGDVVFFSYLLVHGSMPNLSEGRRTALIYQYRSPQDHPLDNAHHDSAGYGMMLA